MCVCLWGAVSRCVELGHTPECVGLKGQVGGFLRRDEGCEACGGTAGGTYRCAGTRLGMQRSRWLPQCPKCIRATVLQWVAKAKLSGGEVKSVGEKGA